MEKKIILADWIIIAPFAWVMSQSILHMDFFWFFIAYWLFGFYTNRRSTWDV